MYYLCISNNKETTLNLYTMSNYIHTLVFFLPQDKEAFITCSKGQRRFKVVSDVDGRTIRIQFRKGTKAERMLNLADMWNAEII